MQLSFVRVYGFLVFIIVRLPNPLFLENLAIG